MTAVSEPDVQVRAQMALANSPIYELRELHVEHDSGRDTLLISGTVSSFYHKQLAQEVVRAVCKSAKLELVNAIRVRLASRGAGSP
jgi:hypothetical protein